MPLIAHGFTHFRLDILPIRCRVTRKIPENGKAKRFWLDVADAAGAAVPAPVKALLSGLLLSLDRDQPL
jgi:A/G-specific adenine glycosylase